MAQVFENVLPTLKIDLKVLGGSWGVSPQCFILG
ncbi:hypothetical protein X925_05775 [Petrotoga sp. 9T1HF07.CasAA.8.2]|nr:hypothetical protein X925_05775 [Petrotoga sp. 9T1HF07.CasAA.8.2]